jgi:Tfp pilus assembly protein PilF
MDTVDRARLLIGRGETDRAARELELVLEEDPTHLGALLVLATLWLEMREDERALALFARATEVAPRSAEALNGQARCCHALGRDAEALSLAQAARSALDHEENYAQVGPVYLTLVWCLRELGLPREAFALAEEGLNRCSDSVLAGWADTLQEELAAAERTRC